jgi:RNA polymerase sigma-70 factor (ECF subfamily)
MSIARHATDADLLAALPDDVGAYERFYRSYVRRVTAFAAKRCSCAEDVADVVAVTFVRLLGAARRYDPALGEPAAFVMGITANVIRDQERRDARQQALLAKLATRERLDDDDVDRIDAAICAAQLTGDMSEALSAIPPGEREMLRLVASGRTQAQAAAQLGISPGAGRVRLTRARRRLRHHINADAVNTQAEADAEETT